MIDLVLRGGSPPGTATPHIEGTLHVSRATGQRATATVSIRGNRGTAAGGDEAGMYVGGVRIFGGIIQEVKLSRIGNVQTNDTQYDLICIGWEHRLDRHVLGSKIYSGMNAGAIVSDLITSECPFEGITLGTIGAGAVAADLGQIRFNGETVAAALDDLATRSNYNWWITPDKVLYFVSKTATAAGTLVLSSASKNFAGLTISETGEDYVNCVKIGIGWDQIVSTAIPGNLPSGAVNTADANYALMTGNGTVRTWTIPNVGSEVQAIDHIDKILLNGIPQEVGILNVATDASKSFFYSVNSNVITQNSNNPALTSADHIQVYYFVVSRNVIVAEDAAEISARAAKEGGSGRYELYVDDSQNSDQVGALKKAQKIIDTRCPGRNGAPAGTWPRIYEFPVYSYTPNSTDLQPGSVISISCAAPSTGGAKSVLIQSVESNEIVGKSTDGTRNFMLHTAKAVDYVPVGDVVDFFQSLTGSSGNSTVTTTGSGTSPVPNPAAGSIAPGSVTLGTPTLFYLPDGDVQISIPVTPPASLGTFKQVYAYLSAPDTAASRPAAINNAVTGWVIGGPAEASQLVGPVQYFPFGPFKYESGGMVLTIKHPAPEVTQTWRIYVTSASDTVENQLVPANQATPTPNVFLTVAPVVSGVSGAEFCPNPRNVTGSIFYPSVKIGADQTFGFKIQWVHPTEDPRYPLIDGWDIIRFHPGFTDDPATPEDERFGLVSPEPAVKTTYTLTEAWRTADVPETYTIYIVPRKANGSRNTIVDGVTASLQITPVKQDVLGNVTGFSVSASYTSKDNDGGQALILIPTFIKPTDNAFTYIEFWAQRPEDSKWYLLGYPAESGETGKAIIYQLPSTLGTWNFLAVSQDANDRDKNGNITTDPTNPPAGTPPFSLPIAAPTLGSTGIEYTGLVTGLVVAAAYPSSSDGTYNAHVTATFTAPVDNSWGGAELISYDGISYVSRANAANSPLTSVIPVPASSQSWTWYVLSYDKQGRRNTINFTPPNATPSAVLIVGSAPGKLDGARLLVASVSTVSLNATEIQVGGGGGKPGYFGVYNAAGSQIGFIGVDTFGNEGAWFKRISIGGTSYSSAPLKADAAGNVSVTGATFTLSSNGITTKIDNSSITGGYFGVQIYNNDNSFPLLLRPGTVRGVDSFSGSHLRFNLDGQTEGFLDLYSSTNVKQVALSAGASLGGTLSLYDNALNQKVYLNASNATLQLGGFQVVATRQTGPGNTTDVTDVATRFNNLLSALRTHGLIT